MRALKLARPVRVTGPSILGKPAELEFFPSDQPGWHWEAPSGTVWPISIVHATHQKRRVRLEDPMGVLEVFEHVGPLLFTGLTGVLIRGSGWPPCSGETNYLWRHLKPHVRETDRELPFSTIRRSYDPPFDENNGRGISIEHVFGTSSIEICVEICYPGLGSMRKEYVLPDTDLLEKAFRARTLGWLPRYLRPFEKAIRRTGAWLDLPLITTANWPSEFKGRERELLELICLHRFLDILGSLSLLVPQGRMLGGLLVTSVCAGHAHDIPGIMTLRDKVIEAY